jgi:hypothetical protein
MSLLIGALAALAAAMIAAWIGFERRSFYTTSLVVIASYYVLFAVMGGSMRALAVELAIMTGFVLIAKIGFSKTMWLIVLALIAHGILDFFHARLVSNPGVPPWWPPFCLGYDVVAGGVLAWLVSRRQPGVESLAFPVGSGSAH